MLKIFKIFLAWCYIEINDWNSAINDLKLIIAYGESKYTTYAHHFIGKYYLSKEEWWKVRLLIHQK